MLSFLRRLCGDALPFYFMGLDVKYQAMPNNCALLERARHDGEFGSHLEFFASYVIATPNRLAIYAGNEVSLDFIGEAKQLARQYPGLENRNYDGGRNWDKLHYLLSEKRRQADSQNENDWAYRALLGGDVLNPQTQTTIGSPIRYLAPDEVREISELLQSISANSLREHWDVAAMLRAAVYKIHPADDDESFDWIKTSYRELAAFYALVAQHGESIITCLG